MNRYFELGQTVSTRTVHELMEENETFKNEVLTVFERYINCDWGDLEECDKKLNDEAVKNNDDRILARYKTSVNDIYIITEWDRSATTILFCNEY